MKSFSVLLFGCSLLGLAKASSIGAAIDQNSTVAPGFLSSFTLPSFTLPTLPPFAPSCIGTSMLLSGSCRTAAACPGAAGIPDGKLGCLDPLICCVPVVAKCGEKIFANNTVLVNPNYPNAYNSSGNCSVSVKLLLPNIENVRIEIIDLDLAQPNAQGVCEDDRLEIQGLARSTMPPLCGVMTNQHIIVPIIRGQADLVIRVVTSGESRPRHWTLRVILLEDNQANPTPIGCRQFFYGKTSGVIESFNFDTLNNVGRGMIADLGYSACFRSEIGFPCINFTANYFELRPASQRPAVPNINETLSTAIPDAEPTSEPGRKRRQSPAEDAVTVTVDPEAPVDSNATDITTTSPPFIPATGPLPCDGLDRVSVCPTINCNNVFNSDVDGNSQSLLVQVKPTQVQVFSGHPGDHGLGFSLRYQYLSTC